MKTTPFKEGSLKTKLQRNKGKSIIDRAMLIKMWWGEWD